MIKKALFSSLSTLILTLASSVLASPVLAEYWTLNGADIYKNNSGNVGIGTSAPNFGILSIKQAVDSATKGIGLSNSTSSAGSFLWTDASGIFRLDAASDGSRKLALNGTGTGFVGIGTTNPGSALDVSGTGAREIRVTKTDALAVTNALGIDSVGISYVGSLTSTGFAVLVGNTQRIRVTTAGNVGIGTTAPTAKLSVDGTIQSTGSSGDVTTQSISATGWYSVGVTFPYTFSSAPKVVVTHNNSGTGDLVVGKLRSLGIGTTGFTISYYVDSITTNGTTKFNWLAIQ